MKRSQVIVACALTLLASCSSFIGGYSARSHEHLTSLKAHHLKLIDDNTKSASDPKRTFSSDKVAKTVDEGELKFREAEEFSKSLNDPLRTENIQLLHDIYVEDSVLITRKRKLLSLPESETLKLPTALAYDLAIKGEQVRKSE